MNNETKKTIKEYAPIIVGIALLCVIETLAAVAFLDLIWRNAAPTNKDLRTLSAVLLASTAASVGFGGALGVFVYRLQKRYRWLLKELNIRFEAVANAIDGLSDAPKPDLRSQNHWPWGSHHTDLLGHLEAAGKQWWVRYEPTDPSTAPTNEMVAEWLRVERNVSREKAQAIASILRADGLRTGPR